MTLLAILVGVVFVFTIMAVRSPFTAFRVLVALGWTAIIVYWRTTLSATVTEGSATDIVVMLIFGLAALTTLVASFGSESDETETNGNGISRTLRRFRIGRTAPKPRRNWREDAQAYRNKADRAINGRR